MNGMAGCLFFLLSLRLGDPSERFRREMPTQEIFATGSYIALCERFSRYPPRYLSLCPLEIIDCIFIARVCEKKELNKIWTIVLVFIELKFDDNG